ncbi:MAG: DNA replication/repair protein RecF [Bacteroidota bacterium]|nr:DNA replication/repair protein RecF [Bacteroidota bacterium]
MYLQQVKLLHFKNYKQAQFRFNPQLNCLVGKNGAGKTNVLDAIYYLAFTRSYFNPVDQQHILFGETFFTIDADLVKNEISENIRLVLQKGSKKSLQVNNNEVPRFADYIGTLPAVMIAPGDINLIYEGSEDRRKFVDMIISQTDHVYLNELMQYNRVLDQRNKLLKDFNEHRYVNRDLLETYNAQLSKSGTCIYEKRVQFLKLFTPLFSKYYQMIAGTYEHVGLAFESDLDKISYPQILVACEPSDFDLLRTTRGIHRDDLVFMINEMPLKKFGSQGQQKSFIIALKLAQFDYLLETKGEKPILLIDDIFEKLDSERLSKLLSLIAIGHFGQIFITDTQAERLHEVIEKLDTPVSYFEISNGELVAV